MGFSRLEYPYTGGEQTFSVNFALGYLDPADVTVHVIGEVDGLGEQINRAYTWVGEGTVQVTDALPNPSTVVVQRTVDKDQLEIDLSSASPVTRSVLGRGFKQLMMNIHELLDGRAATFSGALLDIVTGLRDQSIAARDAAEVSKDAAAASATAAGTDATAAAASATAASGSAGTASAAATQTGLDATSTAADRVQTGLDAVATAADRTASGNSATASAASAASAAGSAGTAGAHATQAGAEKDAAGLFADAAAQSATEAETAASILDPSAFVAVADKATQGEAEAGANNTKYMTPLRTVEAIAQNIPAPFVSDPLTITLSSTVSAAHGLGRMPARCGFHLRCITAEHGYAVGDRIWIAYNWADGNGGKVVFSIVADETNVYGIIHIYNFVILTKGTRSPVQINSANWNLYMEAE
jgi:hypothetical protein